MGAIANCVVAPPEPELHVVGVGDRQQGPEVGPGFLDHVLEPSAAV